MKRSNNYLKSDPIFPYYIHGRSFPGVTVDVTRYKNSWTNKKNLELSKVSILMFLEQIQSRNFL